MRDLVIPTKIYAEYEQLAQEVRFYLGESILGKECERELWYSFRWAAHSTIPGKTLRIFETGKKEEQRLIADLRSVGIEVMDVEPTSVGQWEVVSFAGHVKGHLDAKGRWSLIPRKGKEQQEFVIEFKTHNDASYKKLDKDGVKIAHPTHYAQCQAYMGHTGCEQTLYMALNKNNDAIYTEWVDFDKEAFDALQAKAERIIFASRAPDGISKDAKARGCFFCQHKAICANLDERIENSMSCRTCIHSSPQLDGTWLCERKNVTLGNIAQLQGCPEHLYLPEMLPFGDPEDVTDDTITYFTPDGRTIINERGGKIRVAVTTK
jgi:hypothetical protein